MASITKKADGKYLIRVSKGTGKARTYINKTFRGPLKKAKERARELETDIDSGRAIESGLTFEQYLEKWLAAIKPKLAPRTHDGYKWCIDLYAVPRIGQFKLIDIKTHHVQDVYASTAVGRSATSVRNLHAALNACFNYAVRLDHIRTNPCKHTDLPKKNRREIVVLDAAEARRFNSICSEMRNGLIFEFALETGTRPEEYLALRWSDVAGCDVSVAQAVQFAKGGGYYFKDLKTAKSRRRIPISEALRQRLVIHRREQNEHRIGMKGTWFNHDLIFANEIGRPFQLGNLTKRYFAPIIKKLYPPTVAADGTEAPNPNAKHITLYALRHSCATLLLMNGTNPKVVADRLGHASVVLTLDTYSHVLPHIQEDATNAMDLIMRYA